MGMWRNIRRKENTDCILFVNYNADDRETLKTRIPGLLCAPSITHVRIWKWLGDFAPTILTHTFVSQKGKYSTYISDYLYKCPNYILKTPQYPVGDLETSVYYLNTVCSGISG